MNFCHENVDLTENYTNSVDDDDDFRLNNTSTHECHLHQNNMLTIYINSKFLLLGRKASFMEYSNQESLQKQRNLDFKSCPYILQCILISDGLSKLKKNSHQRRWQIPPDQTAIS